MSIKAATKLVIIGVAFAFVMSTVGAYLFDWAYKSSGLESDAVRRIQRIYYHILALFNYGSLLVFFITLSSKQKAKDKV